MDETLWELFWTTGLPEAYALAKEMEGKRETERSLSGCITESPCVGAHIVRPRNTQSGAI